LHSTRGSRSLLAVNQYDTDILGFCGAGDRH
jgi:hypothetical protein